MVACSGARGPVSHNAGSQPAGDRAYVVDSAGLVEVDPATGAATILSPASGWCSVDARAGVVWFVTGAGLSAFDLTTRTISLVVAGALDEIQPIIQWGNERAGGESALAYAIGLEIAMTATPTATAVVGCDGDAAILCFEDDLETMRPEIAERNRRAEKLTLADPAAIAALAKRGEHRSLWSPAPAVQKPPTPPHVPQARCSEDAGSCGALTPVPGSALWLVTTENSRGDYFHETRELWDPATREYVRATPAGIRRTATLPGDDDADRSDHGGLRISPAGLSYQGLVFDARRVIYAPRDTGQSCGWASGGWRIPGPTDSAPGDVAAVRDEALTALPDTEAAGAGWKVKAGFGEAPSVFDATAATLETLSLEVVDARGASVFRKRGLTAITGTPSPPTECEELRVVAVTESWGAVAGARVSVVCVNGEDDKTASETAILLEIRGKAVRVLWSGEADQVRNEMDACVTSRSVKFSVQDRTLTKHIMDEVERGDGAGPDCKTRKKTRDVKITIPRG